MTGLSRCCYPGRSLQPQVKSKSPEPDDPGPEQGKALKLVLGRGMGIHVLGMNYWDFNFLIMPKRTKRVRRVI